MGCGFGVLNFGSQKDGDAFMTRVWWFLWIKSEYEPTAASSADSSPHTFKWEMSGQKCLTSTKYFLCSTPSVS